MLNSDRVVLNACESDSLQLTNNAKLDDKFCVKKQPYSIRNILDFDERTEQFDGGTIYQTFLSGLSYHRWHSPVSGTIIRNILDFDERAEQFDGGTINQVFFSGLSYHRWHSPVSGTIVKAKVVAFSYYLENTFESTFSHSSYFERLYLYPSQWPYRINVFCCCWNE